jgi:aspartyl/asparaginyl beta-hydroxylase (cupin superfamily)
LFPVTTKAVHDCGVPAVEVFFASMKPHSSIKVHSDFTNFVLTSHLAIDIPYSGENKCRLTIGDETRQWINGDVLVFDTSLLHDAVNESDRTRYILMMRIWHPDLSPMERDALQFIYDCLTFPELVTGSADERLLAQQQLQKMKAFPKISTRQGFSTGAPRTKKKPK